MARATAAPRWDSSSRGGNNNGGNSSNNTQSPPPTPAHIQTLHDTVSRLEVELADAKVKHEEQDLEIDSMAADLHTSRMRASRADAAANELKRQLASSDPQRLADGLSSMEMGTLEWLFAAIRAELKSRAARER